MDYKRFKEYQRTFDNYCYRLDELNPYSLKNSFDMKYNNLFNYGSVSDDYYIMYSKGVRCLIQKFFKYFTEIGYQLSIPSDIYPEYFNLTPSNAKVCRYNTFCIKPFNLLEKDRCLLLIANPLIPEGRYLENAELLMLDLWLQENSSRWLIFDTVYDYKLSSLDYNFQSKNIIFVNSLSKINLNPGLRGWALCRLKLPGFKQFKETAFSNSLSFKIQTEYEYAWESIERRLNLTRLFGWSPPQVGYLSIVNEKFDILLSEYKVAAIPASIFGINCDTACIISCLSEVKQNVHHSRPI